MIFYVTEGSNMLLANIILIPLFIYIVRVSTETAISTSLFSIILATLMSALKLLLKTFLV